MRRFWPQSHQVTTWPRAISITIGMILLAGALPVGIEFLSDLMVKRFNLQVFQPFSMASPNVIALFWFIVIIVPCVMPTVLGATFWWATSRLRQTHFLQVWLESSILAFGILFLGTLLASLAQAFGASIGGETGQGWPPFAAESGSSRSLGSDANLYTLAWNHWFSWVTGWPPMTMFLGVLAFGFGLLGSGLARLVARWTLVRAARPNRPRHQMQREASFILGSVIAILSGFNVLIGIRAYA